MSMTPVRDSTKASPSKQMKSAVTIAKKRSRRRRSATRYIIPTSRLPKSVVLSRQRPAVEAEEGDRGRHQELRQRRLGVEVRLGRLAEVLGGVHREVHLVEDVAADADVDVADLHPADDSGRADGHGGALRGLSRSWSGSRPRSALMVPVPLRKSGKIGLAKRRPKATTTRTMTAMTSKRPRSRNPRSPARTSGGRRRTPVW